MRSVSPGGGWYRRYVVGAFGALLLAALTPAAARALLGVREQLAANREYFVSASGSDDSNDGLTAGTPFATLQKAINVVAALDIATFNVSIQVANGTYTAGFVVSSRWVGSGSVFIIGNVATPASVLLSTTSAHCCVVQKGGDLNISGIEFRTTTTGHGVHALDGGQITLSNCRFGAIATHQMYARGAGSRITATSYTISGGATIHSNSDLHGVVIVNTTTVTLSGTPAFATRFVNCSTQSYQDWIAVTFAGTGATGQRYFASTNGIIQTAGGGATYLPGDAAGAVATQGQYL